MKKLNAKTVGANCIRPHFGEMTLKNQKAITLIALIITIIVMLILVGVTINVALNGGLFSKAEEATKEAEEKAILEEMLAMMEITNEGKINYDAIIKKMEQKYTVKYSYPNAEITGKLGTYEYIVSETEIKIKNGDDNLEALKRELEGKLVLEVMGEDGFLNSEIQLVKGEGNTAIVSFRGEQFTITLTGSEATMRIASVERYNTPGTGGSGGSGGTTAIDDKLAKYLLGQNLQGRNLLDIFDLAGNNFKDDATTPETNEVEELGVEGLATIASTSGYTGDVYLKYNNKAYKVAYELDTSLYTIKTKPGTLSFIYEPKGDEGKTYTFNGQEWTILYDEGSYKEIVSPNVMGDLIINGSCQEIDWTSEAVINAAEIDGTEGLSYEEIRIYSYNNAINSINKHCKNQIDDSLVSDTNVRSVGGTTETSEMFTSPNWSSIYNGKGKEGDTFYKEDCIRMLFYGVFDVGKDYWIASRYVEEKSSEADFGIWYCDSPNLSQWHIWTDKQSGTGSGRTFGFIWSTSDSKNNRIKLNK